ncbi:hypothetical protein EV191_111146 [Tamaricihabitans halophyticus]|uniref:Uncharacterized protein n=1 Tax=Tamaricihabitans halophyticus TaxID=1262583 RepID=A0A4R2QLN4_9PSEU|nr:hypothetical protein [Tamaricihabitans halophyticus]TCP47941.1 hypothetical protein EV191_111146 [Tamaricihabitans halophyticus]
MPARHDNSPLNPMDAVRQQPIGALADSAAAEPPQVEQPPANRRQRRMAGKKTGSTQPAGFAAPNRGARPDAVGKQQGRTYRRRG